MYGSDKVSRKWNTHTRKCYKFSNYEQRKEIVTYEGIEIVSRKKLAEAYEKAKSDIASVGADTNWDNCVRAMRLCPFSFPSGEQEYRAFEVMVRTCGEMGISYPYPHLPLDEHPSLFFEYMNVYNNAMNDYMNRGKSGDH